MPEPALTGLDHLFRRESGRMIATVTRIFGVHNLALAEDVVQDAFWRALEIWKVKGLPENPSAWLMQAAKNRALDALRRERTRRRFAPDIDRLLRSEWTLAPVMDELFGANAIKDDALRMMFSCCAPQLKEEAQVALILNILCGFGVDEIAAAFMNSHAAIEKRIARAKKVLAGSKILFDVAPGAEFSARLPAVQCALYLLFNEGYHGASPETAVRGELAHEAMRLVQVLLDHPLGATPASHALMALMCLNAARLPARVDGAGELIALRAQDRAQWDQALIAKGLSFLDCSARGEEITAYHLEAAIASVHARAEIWERTDWHTIVALYDRLLALTPSPVIALNRAIAVGEAQGPEQGLAAMRALEEDALAAYPFYAAALGEFELRRGRHAQARAHFERASALARNPMERHFLDARVRVCV